MSNIIDYVREYGSYTFTEEPLNEVDSLILCQLVYLNYEKYVPGLAKRSVPVSIQSIYQDPDWQDILDGYWYREDNIELFTAVAESVRFGSLKLNYYINIINEGEETQFSAMTYVLDSKDCYLAYRGTDANIVGWKEDFNLAYSKPIRSQYLSVEYMNRVAGYIGGAFYAGGHSKGGNLAAYAAMNCSEFTKRKILKVYNNDGPGFRPEILEMGNYEAVADRMVKFIPRSSVVGVLLESEGNYEIVESRSFGMLQHNAYNWKVEGTSFVRARNMTNGKVFRDTALNEWILSLSEEETHAFVDTLYEVIAASEAKDFFQFAADWKNCLQSIAEALKDMEEDTRRALLKIVRSGFEMAGEMAAAEVKERKQEIKDWQQELKEWQQEIKRKIRPGRKKS